MQGHLRLVGAGHRACPILLFVKGNRGGIVPTLNGGHLCLSLLASPFIGSVTLEKGAAACPYASAMPLRRHDA